MDKTVGGFVKTVQSAVGSHPDTSLTVAKQTDSRTVADRRGILVVVQEDFKVIAIEAVQSIVSSNPDAAILILAKAGNKTA